MVEFQGTRLIIAMTMDTAGKLHWTVLHGSLYFTVMYSTKLRCSLRYTAVWLLACVVSSETDWGYCVQWLLPSVLYFLAQQFQPIATALTLVPWSQQRLQQKKPNGRLFSKGRSCRGLLFDICGNNICTELAPLGRFCHRVAMSVC